MSNSIEHKEIGRRIELRRKALDLTLSDVAGEVGVAASTIQRYEKGQFEKIKMPVIEAIASALHINPAWLVGEDDDPTDYEDGALLASIPSSYMELFDGDASKALQYMAAVDEEAKKAPSLTEKDERIIAKNENEEDMLLLARHMEPIPEEDRQVLKEQFKRSIDLYLRAKGLTPQEDE